MGDINVTKCNMCGKVAQVNRKYYHYNIQCECHSPNHFEIVEHCRECVPFEPKTTVYTLNGQKYKADTEGLKLE